jgi:CRP/FNR family transcriptional regulator, cyclic AMP receptor protein
MPAVLHLLQEEPLRWYEVGEVVIEQGSETNRLFVLKDGAVEIVKNGVTVAHAAEPGAVFGELSIFLGGGHTATVRALRRSAFHLVANPRQFLEEHSAVCLAVCEMLAHRLDALNHYLVDVKRQYQGHDHLAMVDEVLDSLMHRQARRRVRPSESTIHHGEQPG